MTWSYLMNRQYKLYTQFPKPKLRGCGVLDVDENGVAHFLSGNGEYDSVVLAKMERVRIDMAGSDGIMLSGMQPTKSNYIFQKWWLSHLYLEEEPK